MSVKVDVGELAATMAEYGFAYLVTTGDGGKAHVLAVTPELVDGRIVAGGVGRHTLSNVATNPAATMVWPPLTPGGYSLIVDGDASGDDETATVAVVAAKAILHRPAPGADGKRVGNDCQSIAPAG